MTRGSEIVTKTLRDLSPKKRKQDAIIDRTQLKKPVCWIVKRTKKATCSGGHPFECKATTKED